MNGVIARGVLVAALAGGSVFCLQAGSNANKYSLESPVLMGLGAFLGALAISGFVVWIWRRPV